MDNFYIVIHKGIIADISEFGDARDTVALSESFLAEHGKLHAKNESLVSMVEGVKNLMNG